ncbi:MAG: RodZ domain-containing protein, partial [Acidimicrobiales bacterium]
DSYERSLDLLGDVARRSDASADIRAPAEGDVARAHVTPAKPGHVPHPVQSTVRIVPSPIVRLDLPVEPAKLVAAAETVRVPEAAHSPEAGPPTVLVPVVGAAPDPPTVLVPVVGAAPDPPTVLVPVAASNRSPAEKEPSVGHADVVFDAEQDDEAGRTERAVGRLEIGRNGRPSPERTIRRAATGAAAAVAIGALAVGSYQLASHKSGTPASTSTTSPARGAQTTTTRRRATHPRPSTAPTVAPSTLQPTSTSASVVTYQVPATTYTVSFAAASGACWLGAQQQASGPYVRMWTLAPGAQASYAASGPLVVKIGAPRYVSISVNGTPLVLPAGRDQPYDVSLVPGTSTAA